MTTIKLLSPLVIALALVGCGKKDQPAEAPVATPPATTAPANNNTATSNTATADAGTATNTATATATTNMTPEQHKDAREKIMKDWKKANQTMGGMVKNPSSFNVGTFKDAAAKLNQDAWAHFPAEAKGGDAKDSIWTDTAGFQQEVDKYKKAVTALNTATATATNVDAVKAQFGDVGASCKSCHEKFKKD